MTKDLLENPHLPGSDSDHARPTLKTIAAETGFAVATVSRALKDAPDIGDETKRIVRESATRLGYRPNRAGVRLRTGKTNVIALVLSTEAGMMNHTSRLMYSIAKALRGTTYHMVVMPFFADQDPMDPIRYIVETESADGIVLNQTKPDDPRVRYLFERNFPFATHGQTDMGMDHAFYDFDNEAFARLAVETLVKVGRKRLLLIPPPRHHTYSRHMTKGFSDAAGELGATFELLQGVTSDSLAHDIEAALRDVLRRPNRPDGIVSGSTNGTMAAVTAAEAVGLELDKTIDVVGKEAIPILHMFRDKIYVVQEDVGLVGEFLAKTLVELIEHRTPKQLQGLEIPAPPRRGTDN